MSFLRRLNLRVKPIHGFLARLLANDKFLYVIIGLFVVSAGWIALSNSFPMIFDENYHLGVIDLYANQMTPFSGTQPEEAKYYGDLTRNPSYLYWYVFSFIYSFIGIFTDNIVTTIVILRFINIGLVAVGLWFWRKVLFQLGLGKPAAHLTLLVFTMVPLIPYLAAHINYDNLVFMLMPLLLLNVMALRTTSNPLYHLLIAAGLAGVLTVIKFSMLPVAFVAAVASVAVLVWRYRKKLLTSLGSGFKKTPRLAAAVAIILAIVGIGLFAERYGINYIQYGSHSPDCIEIHDFDTCKEYSVWIRNYDAEKRTPPIEERDIQNPLEFTVVHWIPNIYGGLYVSAAFTDASTDIHQFMPQHISATSGSKTAFYSAAALLLVGVVALIAAWRRMPQRFNRYYIIIGFITYAGAVWLTNYSNYLELGYPYATQGRYMIPFIIPIVGLIILAYQMLTRRQPLARLLLLAILIIGFMGAAGALTYIIYGQPNWQWELGHFQEWNTTLRSVLQYVTL